MDVIDLNLDLRCPTDREIAACVRQGIRPNATDSERRLADEVLLTLGKIQPAQHGTLRALLQIVFGW